MKIYLEFHTRDNETEKVLYMENWPGSPFNLHSSPTLFVHNGTKYEQGYGVVNLDDKSITFEMHQI